jgi:hypothetical protein
LTTKISRGSRKTGRVYMIGRPLGKKSPAERGALQQLESAC